MNKTQELNPVETQIKDSQFSLVGELNNRGYYCDHVFSQVVETTLVKDGMRGSFLFGPAGVGKTQLVHTLAEIFDVPYIKKQAFLNDNENTMIATVTPDDDKKQGFALNEEILLEAVRRSKEGPIFVLIDEWDKTRPSADSVLLMLLQDGYIRHKGQSIQGIKENMYFFLTMNDERELSEPALRRLPYIQFDHLHPTLVQDALRYKRPDYKQKLIDFCVDLYMKTLHAKLRKPATIQELVDLMDAMMQLGGTTLSDSNLVDELILSYVTKSAASHNRLAEHGSTYDRTSFVNDRFKNNRRKLNLNLDGTVDISKEIGEPDDYTQSTFTLSRYVSEKYGKIEDVRDNYLEMDGGGFLNATAENYDAIARLSEELFEESGTLKYQNSTMGKVFTMGKVKDRFEFDKPFHIINYPVVEKLWGMNGEIIFSAPNAKAKDVKLLAKRSVGELKFRFKKHERDCIVGQLDDGSITVLWTPDTGALITVSLKHREKFIELFGAKGVPNNEGTMWLNLAIDRRKFMEVIDDIDDEIVGIMFHRHMDYMRQSYAEKQKNKKSRKKDLVQDLEGKRGNEMWDDDKDLV